MHGTPFLVLIAPNKAAIYPENNPGGWRARYQPGPQLDLAIAPCGRAPVVTVTPRQPETPEKRHETAARLL